MTGFAAELRDAIGAGFPLIVLVTHEEGRARAAVAEAFAPAKVRSWTATAGLEGAGGESTRDPAAALTVKVDGARAFYDLHPFLDDPRVVRALRDFCVAPRAPGNAIVLVMPHARVPPELERDVAVLHLPLPGKEELAAALAAEGAPPGGDAGALVRAALGLSRGEAERAFRMARGAPSPEDGLRRVIAEKRRVLRASAALELADADVDLEAVGGLEVLKQWLRARVLAFDEGARAFGLSEPRGMLVCGVQGCGKSLVSKAAARVLGLPLVRLDFAEVFSTGSPEHAIREAMRVIEAVAPVVLWVDEIEKGLGGGHDGGQVRVFGAFLTWLQERRAPVFVAATANEVDRLPPELARRGRFDEVFFVDLPAAKEREEILALHVARRGRDPALFRLADLAKGLEHFSGAELEQIVSMSLFRAYAQRRDINDADLRASAREVVPLAQLYEEQVQALRTWGQTRARRASADRRTLDLFDSK